jgi:hypothetical protein
LTARIIMAVVGGMCNRQMARAFACSPTTIAVHITRVARQCLLIQARELERIPVLDEIAIDGFETFEWSQYFPFHHNVAVHVTSGYLLGHTDSPLRRKGRMRKQQKLRRAQLEQVLGRPSPRAVEDGVRELLQIVTSKGPLPVIRSDDHRAYPRAIRAIGANIVHRVTSAKERRDRRNPLWEVNLADLMIRHSTAAHKRETISWAKRRQASIEKLTIFQVWRNYIKKRWEKGPPETPAMLLGLADQRWHVKDLLSHRLFFEKANLTGRWESYYRREVKTAALAVNRRHQLSYAF